MDAMEGARHKEVEDKAHHHQRKQGEEEEHDEGSYVHGGLSFTVARGPRRLHKQPSCRACQIIRRWKIMQIGEHTLGVGIGVCMRTDTTRKNRVQGAHALPLATHCAISIIPNPVLTPIERQSNPTE